MKIGILLNCLLNRASVSFVSVAECILKSKNVNTWKIKIALFTSLSQQGDQSAPIKAVIATLPKIPTFRDWDKCRHEIF